MTACKISTCKEMASGCEYCERHHLRLCGQLHHRLEPVTPGITINLTTKQTVKLERVLSQTEDEGPLLQGWASQELQEIHAVVRAALRLAGE